MNIAQIIGASRAIIALRQDYHGGQQVGEREMRLDPILYGYFQGRFGRMSRQHRVQIHGRSRPRRIDFRSGGSNPVVIEIAVRPPTGGSHLYGSQNRGELRKLTRVTNTSARLRVLLLVDLAPSALARENLQDTYREQNAGSGNFVRHRVRVIYVHAHTAFSFIW